MRSLLSFIFALSMALTISQGAFAAEEDSALPPVEAVGTEAKATDEAAIPALKPVVETRKESEIPLNLEAGKKANTEGSGVFRILFTIGILSLLGVGAVVFLRKYKIPKAAKHQTQIKVLQQHFLGPKKSLAIVRVAGESILIGITDHNISMIKALSLMDDEVPAEAPQNFGNVLTGMGNGNDFDANVEEEVPASKNRKNKQAAKELDAEEEFAISGIKDIVSKRLKGMRNFQ